jgi:uncharacterized phosphatase
LDVCSAQCRNINALYIKGANMTKVCIVRHGETDWNAQGKFQGLEDIKLNDSGRKQALNSSHYLKKHNWDAIISSPLSRATETAEIIGEVVGLEQVDIMQEFIERDLGSASGLLPAERKRRFPNGHIPDAEPREILEQRIVIALKLLEDKYNNKNVIVVTHGGVINSIMLKITKGEFKPEKTPIKNGSVTILKLNNYIWELELFNYTEK